MEFILGERIVLLEKSTHIPRGTIGTVVSRSAMGLPRVDFGAYGTYFIPQRDAKILDLPDGAPAPEDGTRLTLESALDLLAETHIQQHLSDIQHRVTRREGSRS